MQNEQNVFDNPTFFEGYKTLRENPVSANTVVEKPALFSLCPDFTGKSVIDLGCGFGENCMMFSESGAKNVVGIDISEKMLKVANEENHYHNVTFIHMSMNNLDDINQNFDVALSSLAMHYIEDFDALLLNVYNMLNNGGLFIFSQEHPLTTALMVDDYWSRDENGSISHYKLTNYSVLGERKTNWLIDGVIKYHRSFSTIINALTGAGFIVEKILEPVPPEAVIQEYPAYRRYYHKPDFLLIRARKS